MVYSNYKSHTKDIVTYAYGQTIGDITREPIFHFGEKEGIEIIHTPKVHAVIGRQIHRLYRKHRK